MAFPIPNNPTPVAQERFDEIHTATCNGSDVTPQKTLPTAITLANTYECALLSCSFEGLSRGTRKKFSVRFASTGPSMQGVLYRHSGKWSSTEDNSISFKYPIYRGFTMSNPTDFTSLDLEILDQDGNVIIGDPTWSNSYFTFHIRHKHDLLTNSWLENIKISNENTSQSAISVENAVQLVKTAVQEQKALQALTTVAIEEQKVLQALNTDAVSACQSAVNLVKSAVDTVAVSSGLVKQSVDNVGASMNANLNLINSSTQEVKAVIDAHKIASASASEAMNATMVEVKNANLALAPKLDDIKISADAVKTSSDAVLVGVQNSEATSIANKDFIKASIDLNKSAIDAFKASNDANALAHQAVSQQISNKTRYNLLY
tara:strand:- start:612 stop:1736 length:1125 start_codon:yes stop_codon:yes gene_type:complete